MGKSTVMAIVGGAIIVAAVIGLSFGALGGELATLLITIGAGLLGVKAMAARRSRANKIIRCLLPLIAGLSLLGCSWRVPLSDRLTEQERARLVEVEQCARSHGAKMWDAYVHSAAT